MLDDGRRQFLALVGGAAAPALAGCTGSQPETATTDDTSEPTDADGDSSANARESLAFDEWVPANDDDGELHYADVDAALAAGVSERGRTALAGWFLRFSGDVLAIDETRAAASASHGGFVVAYRPSRDVVAERLERVGESDVADVDAPEGYEGYETADWTFWLSDGVLLYGADAAEVRALHRAKRDQTDRFVDQRGFEPLAGVIDSATVLVLSPVARYEGAADARAVAWQFTDETATVTVEVPFEDASAAAGFEFPADAGISPLEPYAFDETVVDGRTARVVGTASIDAFDMLTEEAPEYPPSFSVEETLRTGPDDEWDDSGDEAVGWTHVGGGSMPTDQLTAKYEGTPVSERDDLSVSMPGRQWAEGTEITITESEDAEVFESADTVSLWWATDEPFLMLREELP